MDHNVIKFLGRAEVSDLKMFEDNFEIGVWATAIPDLCLTIPHKDPTIQIQQRLWNLII
jgi:hypothetical protein